MLQKPVDDIFNCLRFEHVSEKWRGVVLTPKMGISSNTTLKDFIDLLIYLGKHSDGKYWRTQHGYPKGKSVKIALQEIIRAYLDIEITSKDIWVKKERTGKHDLN